MFSRDFTNHPKCKEIIGKDQITIVEKAAKGFFSFGRKEYELVYDGMSCATIKGNKELAQFCQTMLNGALLCGAGSGISLAGAYQDANEVDINVNEGYTPYSLTVYKGGDPAYQYTIEFEESPLKHMGSMSAQAANNLVSACNQLYLLAFKLGIKTVRDIQAEEEKLELSSPSL